MQYSVKIDAFEGPLDLLLHLINRYEIDIYDIPVSKITEQYLMYIHTMQELQLDIASEYLVMAATLLAIKSKMLLPNQEEELFDDGLDMDSMEEDEVDPREELMRRLLEYRKYKEAANQLKEYESERSQIYTRPTGDLSEFISDKVVEHNVKDVSIYDMLGAVQKMLQRKKYKGPKKTTIQRQEISIEVRMKELVEEIKAFNGRTSFYSLFPSLDRGHIVVTFLAILELMKMNEIHCQQERNFEDIYISLADFGGNYNEGP